MGKTKIKILDDSVQEKVKKTSKKSPKKEVKSESAEANGTVSEMLDEASGGVQEEAKTSHSAVSRTSDLASDKAEQGKVERTENKNNKPTEQKKPQKQGKSKPRSKKYQAVVKDLDRSATYSIDEAVDMVKRLSYSKFNGSLEAHIVMAQTGVRGLVSLPFASGRKIRVLAFGNSAAESGADIQGGDSTLIEIEKGKINFDIIVATGEWMPKLAKAAKILGPRGLMPSPKNGTITDDLKKAVANFQGGKIEYKTEGKAPVMHLALGKLNQPTEELSANIRLLLQTLGKSKIVKVNLSPTMGPSVKLYLSGF